MLKDDMIVGLIGGVSRPTEFCRTFFVRRGEGTPPYGATPSPYLSLWERWPSAARTERVGTLRKHAAVASFLVCTASSFSPDLGSYAAVASIRTYTALSWIPSQSPSVTALPKGEPRAGHLGPALRSSIGSRCVGAGLCPSPTIYGNTIDKQRAG